MLATLYLNRGRKMMLVDGSYLYNVGGAVHPLGNINQSTLWNDAWLPLFVARGELERFVTESVYRVRSSRPSADALLLILKELTAEAEKDENKGKEIGPWPAYRLTSALTAFEVVLAAEFGLTPLFLVTPKRGYDLGTLLTAGSSLFPDSLAAKVPESIVDINAGTRCIAFEMFTASAFHFHRATESVLRKYWEAIRPNKAHPGNKTVGDYLHALRLARKGSPKVKAALRDLKDLYRNPVSHPEYSLGSADESIALMNSIHTAIVLMLEAIPAPSLPAS